MKRMIVFSDGKSILSIGIDSAQQYAIITNVDDLLPRCAFVSKNEVEVLRAGFIAQGFLVVSETTIEN